MQSIPPSRCSFRSSSSTSDSTISLMSRPITRNHQSSIPKSILKLELLRPDVLRDFGEEAVDVALLSVHQWLRPDTFKFVLQAALERQGCLEFLFSCTSHDISSAARSRSYTILSPTPRSIQFCIEMGRRDISTRYRQLCCGFSLYQAPVRHFHFTPIIPIRKGRSSPSGLSVVA